MQPCNSQAQVCETPFRSKQVVPFAKSRVLFPKILMVTCKVRYIPSNDIERGVKQEEHVVMGTLEIKRAK